jgi:hypothetical protein
LGKNEQSNTNKTDEESEDEEEEKCPKCNKSVGECTCDKGPKYVLEEVAEYVELQNKYTELENDHDALANEYNTLLVNFSTLEANFNAVKADNERLVSEIEPLAQFKKEFDKKEKKAMIDSFYMLSDEDKKDVLDNIDNYSLDDIEAKLSVMCVRKKVSFSVDTDSEQNKLPVAYSFNTNTEDDEATPAWVKAALRVAKTLK